MPIKLSELVDLSSYHKGESKSGLDWEGDADNPDTQEESKKLPTDLIENYDEQDLDNQPLKSYIMSIHKLAAELYNVLDDQDDPEEWVMEKAKEASAALNAMHGHISYAKQKVETLDTNVRDEVQERGW